MNNLTELLRKARPFFQQIHDDAEARHGSYGEEFMESGLWETMKEAATLLQQIDEAIALEERQTTRARLEECDEAYFKAVGRIMDLEHDLGTALGDIEREVAHSALLVAEIERLKAKDKRWQKEMDEACRAALRMNRKIRERDAEISRLQEKISYYESVSSQRVVDRINALTKEDKP